MIALRLLVLILTVGMTGIAAVIGVSVLLGMGWVAVAILFLIVSGMIGAGHALWRRYGRSADTDTE